MSIEGAAGGAASGALAGSALGPIGALGGALIGGVGSFLSSQAASKQAQQNMYMQLAAMRHGIKWKVEDAKEAGIHPLFALGASTGSFTPVTGGGSDVGAAMSSMGQDVSRALLATRTASERDDHFNGAVRLLSLQRLGLENQLLASKLRTANQPATPPPLPEVPGIEPLTGPVPQKDNYEERPRLRLGGMEIATDPQTVNMEGAISDRYGDEGPPQWAIAPYIMWRDYVATRGGNQERYMTNPYHQPSRNPVTRGVDDWFYRRSRSQKFGYN